MNAGGSVEEFANQARRWLETVAKHRSDPVATGWAEGSDDVSVFHDLTEDQERLLLHEAMAWQRLKFDAGYGAISWPEEFGGLGRPAEYETAFRRVEAEFEVPPGHETFSVTVGLVAPTVREFGTEQQRQVLIPRFLRTEELCCQLFSEPGAGSDLASLSTRAERDGDSWVVRGQKVWSSGAQFSAWGELIARTDGGAKHAGLTAFMVPMDLPGVTVRPIRQMSGGSSFNEVFLDDVRLPDRLRLGEVGQGWKVALTTLGFERAGSGGGRSVGGSWEQLLALARHLGRNDDPVVRQELARCFANERVRGFVRARVEQNAEAGGAPGPEGSIGKLLWTRSLAEISHIAGELLGPRLTADSGEWGTWAWTAHVLGAPGYRIAGGSDEIQHNIIAERVLRLPRDPRPVMAAPEETDK
ncbi:MAG TPA: acyl-CoA dehydrogenase family protein [Acidimicrobiales bacterium]